MCQEDQRSLAFETHECQEQSAGVGDRARARQIFWRKSLNWGEIMQPLLAAFCRTISSQTSTARPPMEVARIAHKTENIKMSVEENSFCDYAQYSQCIRIPDASPSGNAE